MQPDPIIIRSADLLFIELETEQTATKCTIPLKYPDNDSDR